MFDEVSSDLSNLIPLPIQIYNYRDENGDAVNRGMYILTIQSRAVSLLRILFVDTGDDPGKWQFVRRFFLSQSLTDTPSYAKYMHMR